MKVSDHHSLVEWNSPRADGRRLGWPMGSRPAELGGGRGAPSTGLAACEGVCLPRLRAALIISVAAPVSEALVYMLAARASGAPAAASHRYPLGERYRLPSLLVASDGLQAHVQAQP